ncbi:MAG: hypothetical protein WBO36_04495 [Saprospiraceae bacterium]
MLFIYVYMMFCSVHDTSSCAISPNIEVDCDTLNATAAKLYRSNSTESLKQFVLAADCFLYTGNYKKAAYCYLNMATLYEQKFGKIDNSLIFANLSLSIHLDTFHQANLIKYIGLLHGEKGDFILTQKYLTNAIRLYEKIDFEPGLNVCYFNLANVKYLSGDFIT